MFIGLIQPEWEDASSDKESEEEIISGINLGRRHKLRLLLLTIMAKTFKTKEGLIAKTQGRNSQQEQAKKK